MNNLNMPIVENVLSAIYFILTSREAMLLN